MAVPTVTSILVISFGMLDMYMSMIIVTGIITH